jgi:hypothetical protein
LNEKINWSILKVYKGAKTSPQREIVCSYYALDAMDFAVGRLYVLKHFNNHSKKEVY